MGREVNRVCELSCDETVIKFLNTQERRAYGDTLLNAMSMGGKYKDSLASVTLSESTELLKERLDAIMKFKKPSKIIITITVILTMFFTLGASFTGIYTAATDNAKGVENRQLPKDTAIKPSLALDIRSAAVDLQVATDGKISAEYNSSVYNVEINDQGNDWKVNISCKTKTNTNTETIVLYIPDVNYSDINMNVDSAYLTSAIIKSGNIIGNFNTASVLLTLPKGFDGSLDATATSGYFELISKDDFINTNVTIVGDGEIGEIYAPKDFIKNGNTFTFTNGTQNNVIKVTRKGTGVIGIYSSDYSDSVDSPSDWQSEWENSWQGDWWKSWNNPWQTGNNTVANSANNVTVSFNGVSIIGQGPVGVELVKSKNSNVTFELLNMEKENTCMTDANIVNGIMQITVNNDVPNGINVDFGPEYKNVVRVYIPDAVYTRFDIQTTEMVVQMQDFNAPVHVELNRAGFWLIDEIVSQGTYDIKVSSGPIYIEADTILNDITANAVSGPLTVRFNKAPTNLYLDTTNCGPSVERPDDWSAIYKIGNETPKMILSNNGKATVEIQNNSITN